jgi:hypothetical protein
VNVGFGASEGASRDFGFDGFWQVRFSTEEDGGFGGPVRGVE